MSQSLLIQSEKVASMQPALFSTADLLDECFSHDGEDVKFTFTGAKLFKTDPGKYRMIVDALAEGMAIRQIARAFKVSPGTVNAVKENEVIPIGAQKEKLANKLHTLAKMGVERLIDENDKIPLNSLAVVVGIAIEKMQLLQGEATQRIESTKAPSMEDFNKYLETLKNVTETGFSDENKTSKEVCVATDVKG
jgi:transcriptional regulator with XRE-family HTH domain